MSAALRSSVGGRRGVSLVELMVALAILSISVLAGIGSFRYITMSIHKSRTRTLANNLVQEQMEVLKNVSYYSLLVSTDLAVDNDHGVTYDAANYPLENINLWGYPPFRRATYVAYAEISGTNITTVSYTASDTGLKQIATYIMWKDGDDFKTITIKNLLANPSTSGLDSGINGTVTDGTTLLGLEGAIVQVVGYPNWTDTATNLGAYSFEVADGTYSVKCTSAGYYTEMVTGVSARRSVPATQNFTMVRISSGHISTIVWLSTHLVIAGAVVSTDGTNGKPPSTLEREYIELFNPTSYTWTMDAAHFELWYRNKGTGPVAASIPLAFNTPTLSSHTYYLITSTGPVYFNGTEYAADAYFNDAGTGEGKADVIKDQSDGGIGIKNPITGEFWDKMCWSNVSGPAPPTEFMETECGPFPNGFEDGMQVVRRAHFDPDQDTTTYASAYDTDNLEANVKYALSVTTPPRNSSFKQTPIAGRPAHGAIAVASDGLSIPARTIPVDAGADGEHAIISILWAATGTWTVTVTSGAYMQEITNVSVTQGTTRYVPNSGTDPVESRLNTNHTILYSTSSGGFLQGYVKGAADTYGSPIEGILVEADGSQARTSADGYYFLNADTGTVVVNANWNSDIATFETDSSVETVTLGEITQVDDFHLGQASVIMGWVTSGTGALPNIVVRLSRNGADYEGFSDGTGYFYVTVTTSSFKYTAVPILASGQSYSSNPDPMETFVLAPGQTVNIGTITVVGGMGTITGTVMEDGGAKAIGTGVLIIASEGAINNPPDAIYGSSAAALSNPVFTTSSQPDGTYSLDVVAGTYNMSAYYPVVDTPSGVVTYPRETLDSVVVTAGAETSGKNFTWP